MDRVMSQRNGSLITGQPEHKVLRQVKILHLQYSWSDRHRRKAAEMEMERMGHDALPSLISLMGVASKPNVGSRRAGFLVWTLFATMVTTMCVGSAAASGSWREVIACVLFCGTLFGLCGPCLFGRINRRSLQCLNFNCLSVSQTGDPFLP